MRALGYVSVDCEFQEGSDFRRVYPARRIADALERADAFARSGARTSVIVATPNGLEVVYEGQAS